MKKVFVLIAVAVGCSLAVQVARDSSFALRGFALGPAVRKYILTVALAIALGHSAAILHNRYNHFFSKRLVPLALAALCLMMFMGQLQSGLKWPTNRWLRLGSVSAQPAEFLRLAVAVIVVMILSDLHVRKMPSRWRLTLVGLMLFLLLSEGDLSTLLLLFITLGTASYYFGQGRL
jgi:cell division protein FtsW (lipid II flippase)